MIRANNVLSRAREKFDLALLQKSAANAWQVLNGRITEKYQIFMVNQIF